MACAPRGDYNRLNHEIYVTAASPSVRPPRGPTTKEGTAAARARSHRPPPLPPENSLRICGGLRLLLLLSGSPRRRDRRMKRNEIDAAVRPSAAHDVKGGGDAAWKLETERGRGVAWSDISY